MLKSPHQKIAGGVAALIAAAILAFCGVRSVTEGVTELRQTPVAAEGDGKIDLSVESSAKQSGTHDMKFGPESVKAENALFNGGQQMFLNVALRGQPAFESCNLFMLTSAQAAPAKTATMATLIGNELTNAQSPGYARKTVTFTTAPVIDAVSGDYYVQSNIATWVPSGNWAQNVGWVGLVCGSIATANAGDTSGSLVSLAQVSPARTVTSTDIVASSYKVFQR